MTCLPASLEEGLKQYARRVPPAAGTVKLTRRELDKKLQREEKWARTKALRNGQQK